MRASLILGMTALFLLLFAPAALAQVEVQEGDTLSTIANQHGTSWEAVHQANAHKISDPNLIFPGQVLSLSGSAESPQEASDPPADTSTPETSQEPAAPASGSSGVPWDSLAECESNQTWDIDTGNGFYGGLQFEKRSWDWAGGQQYAEWPHHATREQQIAVAERLLEIHPAGIGAWPACADSLGLR